MPTLFIVESFQYNGKVYRCGETATDATLSVSLGELKEEAKRGRHEKTGNWLSPILNHCMPGDKDSEEIFGYEVEKKVEKDDTEEIEKLRAEFDDIGKAYDKRWQLKRLQNELLKAKKEAGV